MSEPITVEVVNRKTRETPVKRARKKAKVKKVSKSLSKLKRELDAVFSQWVRMGATTCYTCGKGGTLQCGHFVSRLYLATRWEPDNCRPQCVGCNIWGSGKPLDFEEHLIREIGAPRVQELKDARKILMKPTRAFYEENIAKYKALLEG